MITGTEQVFKESATRSLDLAIEILDALKESERATSHAVEILKLYRKVCPARQCSVDHRAVEEIADDFVRKFEKVSK